MTRLQIIVIAAVALLFMGLYWGADTKPKSREKIERERAVNAESTDANSLVQEAKAGLSPEQLGVILQVEQDIQNSQLDSIRLGWIKKLSGSWYDLGRADIAGVYAEQVAEMTNTETAWSIAGTTYTIGSQQTNSSKVRQFCSGRAIRAFENAISLNPDNMAHKVNLAICYTDNPPQGNPMKGILMLRELNEEDPKNILVLNTLGRLAIQTGQYARAIERLRQAEATEPTNSRTLCLLAQAFRGNGDTALAAEYEQKCNQ